MPRGQKSKLRAREKRHQARAQNTVEEPAAPDPSFEGPDQASPAAAMPTPPNKLQGAHCTSSHACENAGAPNQDEKSSDGSDDSEEWNKDPINHKVVLLVKFLIEKYQTKEVITRADMLKCVFKTSKKHFTEILKRTTEYMQLAFGVDLKEVDPIRHCYALFNKLELTFDGRKEEKRPNTGLLMMVLGLIFNKGNCASEKEVWEVLNIMGVYAHKKHCIYGEAKKVITEDLVRLKYLEYRKVPDSNPPSFEFSWGSRAQAEISKKKILEFWAKIHDTTPDAFKSLYEKAVKDDEERAQARSAARARTAAMSSSHSKAMTSSSSQAK